MRVPRLNELNRQITLAHLMPKDGFWFRNGNFHLGRLFLIMFALEMAIFVGIASQNISNPDLLRQFQNQQSSILSRSIPGIFAAIFTNNAMVASFEFVPAYGILVYLETSFWTAVIVAIEGGPSIPGIVVLISLALVPHFWLELPAYAIAATGSIYLLYAVYALIRGRGTFSWDIAKVAFLYAFVLVELLVAAIFETAEIYFQSAFSAYSAVIYMFLLWIPGACVIVLLVFWFRWIERFPKKKETAEETVSSVRDI